MHSCICPVRILECINYAGVAEPCGFISAPVGPKPIYVPLRSVLSTRPPDEQPPPDVVGPVTRFYNADGRE